MADPERERSLEPEILRRAAAAAQDFVASLDDEPAAPAGLDDAATGFGAGPLPERGLGGAAAMHELIRAATAAATRSAGPRFFHFVTGGSTPAALGADWLTSAIDQNSFSWISSPVGSRAERVAVEWLKDLFRLPRAWGGVLTTGATMANFTALCAARRWWGLEQGVDVDRAGWSELPPMPVLTSGYVHASAVKALGMLGVGRESIRRIAADATGRLDLDGLAAALKELDGRPAVIIATAGEVNAGDFDPVASMAELARTHHAWLHVDGAFGLFARVSSSAAALAAGVEDADSVSADGHKWLNVPYDCGFAFVRDPSLLHGAFAATGAPYLPIGTEERPSFGDFGPEMSRRARALPVWATLAAYGLEGYREMVDRHIRLARRLGAGIDADPDLELLAPVRINVVCFRYRPQQVPAPALDELNQRLGAEILSDGRVYFGTTLYGGSVAFRPAISNWRTEEHDVDLLIDVTREVGQRVLARTNS